MTNNNQINKTMKKTPLILSIIALVGVIALAIVSIAGSGKKATKTADAENVTAEKGAIVYFNLDKVLEEYDMANDLRSAVETKVQSISDEINRRGSKLQKDMQSFQDKIDKGLMTRSTAEVQGAQLQERQNSYQNYVAQKQQEMQEEQAVMMNKIADAIKSFIDEYNAEKEYAMIISTQGDILPAPVAAGDPGLDITQEIIDGLNSQYVKNKEKSDE